MAIFSKKTKKETPKAAAVAAPEVKPNLRGENARRVLVRPHVSEKSLALEPKGTYAFLVRGDANKTLVKEEVERRYKVKVVRVNIVRTHAARRFFRGVWHEGFIEKKALVTLAEGAKIEFK